jgi:hypothetical protein
MEAIVWGWRTAGAAGAVTLALGCGAGEVSDGVSIEDRATKTEISELAGNDAARCVFSAPGLELCGWRIEAGSPAWTSLASASGGGDLNLLCELPIDGTPRAEDSCRAHPRTEQSASAESLPPVGAAGTLESHRLAEQRIGEALMLRDLSHLVGDVPDRCKTGLGVQTCEWSLQEGIAGYQLVAALVEASGSGDSVQLRCVIPLDGSARSAESCGVAWAE